MSPVPQPASRPIIHGTWFEFQHHNRKEGVYWNPACAQFTPAQWEAKLQEMAALGIRTVVLMATALDFHAFYRTTLFPPWELATANPLEVLLSAADRAGLEVFVGGGFYGIWDSPRLLDDQEARRRRLMAIGEIAAGYAHHPSFAGWYWPNEAEIKGHFADDFIAYVNECSAEARKVTPRAQTMIAPYGTRQVAADDLFVRQLDQLDIDILAYQDEVGVEKTQVAETAAFFETLRRLHNRAQRAKLWADVEIFSFEGKVYHSALLPAPFERVRAQLAQVAPYVDRILVYQYLGLMSAPGGSAYAGHPTAAHLHHDYAAYASSLL